MLNREIKHLVMFSGGVVSWATAKRVVERHGTDGVVLLFADTLIEDADLYRFLEEGASNIGAPLVRISDGRDPWQVFRDTRFIANTRVDVCSRILKRELLNEWRDENCTRETATIYLGMTFEEQDRLERTRGYNEGWQYEAPLCDKPWVSHAMAIQMLKDEGIAPPRLYALGFEHNNCGGFRVKAGHKQFKRLLEVFPDLYRYHEAKEQQMRWILGKDISILRDRRGGELKTLTLTRFREKMEANEQCGLWESQSGCACGY